MAPYHEAGLPIRIAVATVSGRSIGCPATIGAAPVPVPPPAPAVMKIMSEPFSKAFTRS